MKVEEAATALVAAMRGDNVAESAALAGRLVLEHYVGNLNRPDLSAVIGSLLGQVAADFAEVLNVVPDASAFYEQMALMRAGS